jgi:hypothetical protein
LIHVRDSSDGHRRKPKAKNAKKQLREGKSHSMIGGHDDGHGEAGNRQRGTDFALHVKSHLSSVFDMDYNTISSKVNIELLC